MPAQIHVKTPGLESLCVELVRTSRYYKCVIDQGGCLMDMSDAMDVKTVAEVEGLKDPMYKGCRIDALGMILTPQKKILGRTTDFEELSHDICGYHPMTTIEVRERVSSAWGWPVERISFRRPCGQLLHVGDVVDSGCVLIATRAPWRVRVALIVPRPGGSSCAGESGDTAAGDYRVDLNVEVAPGCATLWHLKRRVAPAVGLPMACFAAFCVSVSDSVTEASESSASPHCGPGQAIGLDDDLETLGVRAIALRMKPPIFRALVEIRNRDPLWRAGIAGDSRNGELPLAKLGAAERDINISLAKEILGAPCTTKDGCLDLYVPAPVERKPFRLIVRLQGLRGSDYQAGAFEVELTLPADWPGRPPRCRFITPIYHCNIRESGELPEGALGLFEDDWKQSYTIFDYLGALLELLAAPDPWSDSAARPDLATQLKTDSTSYHLAVHECVRLHAMQPRS